MKAPLGAQAAPNNDYVLKTQAGYAEDVAIGLSKHCSRMWPSLCLASAAFASPCRR